MGFPRDLAGGRRASGRGAHPGAASSVYIGVDGGGSKTTALVASADGRVIGRGESGTSNHHVVGWRAAFAAIAAAVAEARQTAGLASLAHVLCVGLAGADTPLDQAKCTAWLRRQKLARQVRVVNDGALLLAATGAAPGVAVVSGTGSIAWGHDGTGRQARAGGWGHLMGDEGSGYHISVAALKLTSRAVDGRSVWGPLPRAVMRALKVKDAHGLLAFVYGESTSKTDVARLAPVVFRLAAAGDLAAIQLVEEASAALAEITEAVVRGLALEKPAVVFGGSLLARQRRLREAVVAKLSFVPRRVAVVREPARGALWLAQQVQ